MSSEAAQQHRETADLWTQMGLEELRQALEGVEALVKCFEASLRSLPPCTACARVALIQQVDTTGTRLGSRIIGLTVLAASLKEALAAVEQAGAALASNPARPCRCPGTQCTCHGE